MSKATLFGKELQSFVVIGSGPLSYGARGLERMHEAGAGAVVTKTIGIEAARNPNIHMVGAGAGSLVNCEGWSDYPGSQWVEREIPEAVSAGVKVIASIGQTVADTAAFVEPIADAGVLAIELVSYDRAKIVPLVRDARARTDLPLIVKLSANWPDMLEAARQCEEEGADAFTACDSMGPALRIDIERQAPVLGGPGGTGWLTGADILPFALERVWELRRQTSLPIIGLGGVTRWQDAVEMSMAGADLVGVCTLPILKGPAAVGKLVSGVDGWLAAHGHARLADVSGAAQRDVATPHGRPFELGFDLARCTHCGQCERVCAYEARGFDAAGEATVDYARCRHCGLCASVCPRDAISVEVA